jgi:hypothetical protein
MIETRKREHSRKPDEQYELIEACSPGPHLELFARHPRKGVERVGRRVPRRRRALAARSTAGTPGGPIDTPDLDPYERLQPDTQAAVAAALREQYENNKSIRELAAETGYKHRPGAVPARVRRGQHPAARRRPGRWSALTLLRQGTPAGA